VSINPKQSLIRAGESPEEDLRFELAVRVETAVVERTSAQTSARTANKPCSRRFRELYRIVTET
jgi:hypothetical protein